VRYEGTIEGAVVVAGSTIAGFLAIGGAAAEILKQF
jgi:hypothetical protein